MASDQNLFKAHQPAKGRSKIALISISVLICLVLLSLDLGLGSVHIPPWEVLKVLAGQEVENKLWHKIIFMIRLPKALSAILAGSALAVAGLQMQTLFRNPLAGPSVLGITAGASLGVALVMLSGGGAASIYAIRQLGVGGSWLIVLASGLGAGLVMSLILLISVRLKDNISLLIVGIMIGNISISIVSIWQYFSEPEQIQDYLMWTFGSLGGVTSSQLSIFSIVVLVGLLMAFGSSKSLNTLLLGENYARSLGLNIRLTRFFLILTTSMLAGSVTGFCGPIAFIGIAVPHIARSVLGTSDHRVLIPASLVMGAMLMLACDIIAQLPGSQMSLPINAITALIGSPIVVWVIVKNRNLRTAF
ncbi:MAG: iron ABC transporter permease [Cyclobacteriaceae bacterium]|nr:iron ABC transporter permease [Cyclobacteriaceae bacterium]